VLQERVRDVRLSCVATGDVACIKVGQLGKCVLFLLEKGKSLTATEYCVAYVRHYPMEFRLRRPSIPKQANGHQNCAWDYKWNPILRFRLTLMFLLESRPDTISSHGSKLAGYDVPCHTREIMQSANGGWLLISISPQRCERG
jgi:hypothetical protein